jgi:photosystem II stability/assembly factor-like uncharacterized protein
VKVRRLAIVGTLPLVLLTACGGRPAAISRPPRLQSVIVAPSARMEFVDAERGWLVQPDSGAILVTANGGSKWSPSYSGPDHVSSIDFVDGDDGWGLAGGDEGDTLLRTTDGGRHWYVEPEGQLGLEFIEFTGPDSGWALTDGDGLLETTSGGTTWHTVPTPSATTALCADTSKMVWVAQPDGTIEKSSDGGRHWTISLASAAVPQPVAHIAPPGVVPPRLACSGRSVWTLTNVLCGAGSCAYVMMHTADSGAHWKVALGSGPNLPSSLPKIDSSGSDFGTNTPAHAWFFGISDTMGTSSVVTTSDGGATYHHYQLYPQPRTTAVVESAGTFLNVDRGWAVVTLVTKSGPSYALVATTNGGATWKLHSPIP